VKLLFATGRVLSVAALGELLVRPWFRWDGPPGRRQSHKNDTMGVGFPPTARIGVGAGPRGQALVTAVTPVGQSLLTLLSSNLQP